MEPPFICSCFASLPRKDQVPDMLLQSAWEGLVPSKPLPLGPEELLYHSSSISLSSSFFSPSLPLFSLFFLSLRDCPLSKQQSTSAPITDWYPLLCTSHQQSPIVPGLHSHQQPVTHSALEIPALLHSSEAGGRAFRVDHVKRWSARFLAARLASVRGRHVCTDRRP